LRRRRDRETLYDGVGRGNVYVTRLSGGEGAVSRRNDVAVTPDTVQTPGVVDAKLTGSPELAEAVSENWAAPKTRLPKGPNEILCAVTATLNVCVTGAAAK
jgi:hypothetical protein